MICHSRPGQLAILAAMLATALTLPKARAADASPTPIFNPGSRILFQGDSITDGNRGRNQDPNHILGHGYVFIIAARYGAAFPDLRLAFLNRGVSGDRVGDLAARWKRDTLDLQPDVLSVLVGVNDLLINFQKNQPVSVGEYERAYDKLLADAVAASPKVKLVLCEPFILPGKNTNPMWTNWLAAIQEFQAVVARLAEKYHAPVVHFQRIFDEACRRAPVDYWIWDGIHPTYSGHQLMADEWVRTVAAFYGRASPTPALASEPRAKSLDTNVNTALVPVPKLEQDSYNWYERHAAVLELQKNLDPEVVLVGDSITHFWGGEPRASRQNGANAWQSTFGDHTVLNLGFGWDRTQNVLWRLENGELDGLHPRVIILNIGCNNFSATANARANTPGEVSAAIQLICDKLHAKCPSSRLIVMAVFPRGLLPTAGERAPIKALDELLAKALPGKPGVTFLDIGNRMLEPDGSISRDVLFDGTHPAEKGYAIWGAALLEAHLFSPP